MILYQASTKHFRKQPTRNHSMRTADPLRIPSFVLKRVNGMVCTQAINLNMENHWQFVTTVSVAW